MRLSSDPEKWIVLEEVDSTNTYALRNKSLPSGTVILAELQTAGRGRMEREWTSLPGNSFIFTGILEWESESAIQEKLHFLPLLTGLAVAESAASVLEENGMDGILSVKWPNDVYLERGGRAGKLAGVLVENEVSGSSMRCAVGVGLNWKGEAPEIQGDQKSAVLLPRGEGNAFSFALPLVNRFNFLMDRLLEDSNFILDEILKMFYLRDKTVLLSGKKYGVAGMDGEGALILVSADDGREVHLQDTSEKILLV